MGGSTYANQPVLLKVWKSKCRSRPSFSVSDNHETSSWVISAIRFSTLLPKSIQSTSLTGTTKVTAWIPLEVYKSTYLLKCFGFAPSQPSNTTVTAGPRSLTLPPLTPPWGARFHSRTFSLESNSSGGEEWEWERDRRNPNGLEFGEGHGGKGPIDEEARMRAKHLGFMETTLGKATKSGEDGETLRQSEGRWRVEGNLREVDLLRSEAERWRRLRAEELKILNEASMAESSVLRVRVRWV